MARVWVERWFPANARELHNVLTFVSEAARPTGLGAQQASRLELALEEALVNVCSYAYPDGRGEVVVRVQAGKDRVIVELEDGGAPFDPLSLAEPDVQAPLEERAPGGLGILLVRRMMDEVRYRRDGDRNVLTLVLRRAG